MIEGSLVAIVTPFRDGKIDDNALEKLVEFHIENGSHGIVACGTTGESPTLSHSEHQYVIKATVDMVNGRVPVIAGTGSNSTREAISLTQYAEKAGADATLVVVPYYNKPTQQGLYNHFKEIASASGIPLILYNVPGRTGVNLEAETTASLAADCANITGIKEASGSLPQATRILSMCDSDFRLYSGEDPLNLPLLSIGAKGFITVTANIVPAKVAELYESYSEGDTERAREIHYYLTPLNEALFIESNPIPVKTALNLMGMVGEEIRSPLCKMSHTNLDKLKKALRNAGLVD